MSNVNKVKEALALLVGAQLVLERRGKESRTYYKINSHKLREISERLQSVTKRK
jgi:hypothetical protein